MTTVEGKVSGNVNDKAVDAERVGEMCSNFLALFLRDSLCVAVLWLSTDE